MPLLIGMVSYMYASVRIGLRVSVTREPPRIRALAGRSELAWKPDVSILTLLILFFCISFLLSCAAF